MSACWRAERRPPRPPKGDAEHHRFCAFRRAIPSLRRGGKESGRTLECAAARPARAFLPSRRDATVKRSATKTSIMHGETAVIALLVWLAAGGALHAEAQAPVQQVAMPDAEKIVLLLRTTLLTLNDALQTGNFTVLRDKGAPGFRNANTPAQLSQARSEE